MQKPEWFNQFEKRFESGQDDNHEEHAELRQAIKAVQEIEVNCQLNHLPHIQTRLETIDATLGVMSKTVSKLKWALVIIGALAAGMIVDNPDAIKKIIEVLKEVL